MVRSNVVALDSVARVNRKRARLVEAMLEIAALDRDAYRELRAEIWRSVAMSHNGKCPEQLREWSAQSS